MAWTQQAYDAFTDTPLTPLASHTPDQGSAWIIDSGTWRININGDKAQSLSSGFARNSTTLADKQAVECTNDNDASTWIFLRYATTGGGQGYLLESNAGINTRLWKVVGGDPRNTQLGSNGSAASAGDVLRLEADGSSLAAYINGVSVITATDSSYASGVSGMYQGGGAPPQNDDFRAYDDAGTVKANRLPLLGVS